VHARDVLPREHQPVFHVAVIGIEKRMGDTVAGIVNLARAEAFVGAVDGNGLAAVQALKKAVADRASGNAYGTLDDDDVVFGSVEIRLLERVGHAAFAGAHKPGRHLYARRAQRQHAGDVVTGVDASRGDDGDLDAERVFERLEGFEEFGQEAFEREVFGVRQFVFRKAKVAARQRALEDDGLGGAPVTFFPRAKDQGRGPARTDDRDEINTGIFHHGGKLERQSRAHDDHLDALADAGADERLRIAENAHDVHRDGAAGGALGLADLFGDGLAADAVVILARRADVADADAGNGADAALIGHGGRQR
jgi:hypothetical protein